MNKHKMYNPKGMFLNVLLQFEPDLKSPNARNAICIQNYDATEMLTIQISAAPQRYGEVTVH